MSIDSAVEAAAASALAKAREGARSAGLRPTSGRGRTRPRIRPSEYSGARADGRDPVLVGDHLGRLLSERGWQVEVAVGSVISRWPAVVGPEVAQHVTPETFEDGVLTVRADSPSWATNLRYMVPLLLEHLAADLGEGKVTDLRIVGPASQTRRRGQRYLPGGRGAQDPYE